MKIYILSNSWELERKTIETIKWTIGCIYCQHFPSFKDSFRNEFENWHHTNFKNVK